MHKLTVTLKQHTPLIHFQHDQEGATLRASEVKPKLDKFIVERCFHNNFEECREFLVGYNPDRPDALRDKFNDAERPYRALDYKMRIGVEEESSIMLMNERRPYTERNQKKDKEKRIRVIDATNNRDANSYIVASGEKVRYIIKENNVKYIAKKRTSDNCIIFDLNSYPNFFANLDADYTDMNEYKKLSYNDSAIKLEILVDKSELYNIINSNILSLFFLNTNFGTRQSKGFGSFYIDDNDSHYSPPHSMYHFRVIAEGDYLDDMFRSLYDRIELFYRTLRGGINQKNFRKETEFYFKSLAFKYAKEEMHAKWDKKKVKEEFYINDLQDHQSLYEYDKDSPLFFESSISYDIRDMLGFSTNEQWLSYGDNIEKKVAFNENGKSRYPRENDNLLADRMPSPIMFKPIYNEDSDIFEVYLIIDEHALNLFKQAQKICFYSKKKKNNDNNKKRFMLDIPQSFSVTDYLDFIFNKNRLDIEIEDWVDKDFHEHKYFNMLSDIYSQIKENLQ